MTPFELEIAQWLHRIHEDGRKAADRIDPERKGPRLLPAAKARILGRIELLSQTASQAFFDLMGFAPDQVNFFDLHTEKPAPWTRKITRNLR